MSPYPHGYGDFFVSLTKRLFIKSCSKVSFFFTKKNEKGVLSNGRRITQSPRKLRFRFFHRRLRSAVLCGDSYLIRVLASRGCTDRASDSPIQKSFPSFICLQIPCPFFYGGSLLNKNLSEKANAVILINFNFPIDKIKIIVYNSNAIKKSIFLFPCTKNSFIVYPCFSFKNLHNLKIRIEVPTVVRSGRDQLFAP